jgi:hypothetical protein
LTPDTAARERMIAQFDMDTTRPEWACGHALRLVLRGIAAKPDTNRPGLRLFDSRLKGADQPALCDA